MERSHLGYHSLMTAYAKVCVVAEAGAGLVMSGAVGDGNLQGDGEDLADGVEVGLVYLGGVAVRKLGRSTAA